MIEFASAWVFLLIPLPILVYFLFPKVKKQKTSALVAPFYADLVGGSAHKKSGKKSSLFLWPLAFLSWLAMVCAAANPQWVGKPVALLTQGRDLMLAVDLSASMDEADFNYKNKWIDRLTATKIVAGDFIERRKGDRLGLILFADKAYTQTPLTFDRETVRKLLDESVLGLAGQQTAIGDAIGLAIKKMQVADQKQKILILLTDGANTAGSIDPITAAQLAADEGLKVYTIGIGSKQPRLLSNIMSQGIDLDEKGLQRIAQITNGKYFRASNLSELNKIYEIIDQFEPVSQEQQYFRPKTSIYYWPLLFGCSLLSLLLFAMFCRRRFS